MTPTGQHPRIPINNPQRAYEELGEETRQAVLGVLESGQYVLGKATTDLESAFARYVGSTHAIAVSSGTEALLTALQALEVGPGDEVITSAYSFIASGTCIARVGAKPVFVDIDPDTFQMDPAAFAEAITPRTRAVIAVHLYGYPAPMDEYLSVANEPDDPIAVIEDAAQAAGTICRVGPGREARLAGSIGLWGCFSFYPTKNLAACGDAGLMTTSQPIQAERARQLRVHGMDEQYHHIRLGGNGRMDEFQAAVVAVRLRHLDEWNQRRARNADLYDRLLAEAGLVGTGPEIRLPPRPPEGETSNWHQYTIRAKDRDALRQSLTEKGITSGIYYPIAIPMQPVFKPLGYVEADFPRSAEASREVLSLPIHQHLTTLEVERIVDAIVEHYR